MLKNHHPQGQGIKDHLRLRPGKENLSVSTVILTVSQQATAVSHTGGARTRRDPIVCTDKRNREIPVNLKMIHGNYSKLSTKRKKNIFLKEQIIQNLNTILKF